MKIRQSIKMAWAAVLANKMRSFLTMLGIIIGVMAVTLLISIVQGGTGTITDQMDELGGNQLIISITDRHKKLSYQELKGLEGTGGIAKVSPSVTANVTAKAEGKSEKYTLEGITPAYKEVQRLKIETGRNFTEYDMEERLDVCIIGTSVAKELFGTKEVLGARVRVLGSDYRIVGILEEQDASMMGTVNDTIFLPLSTAQRAVKQTLITSFYLSAESEDRIKDAQNTIDNFLKNKYGNDDAYTIVNMSNIIDMIDTVMGTLSVMLGGIAAISLLVGGIGIMNIMLVSVTERTREIGIRKAIGAQRSDITVQFMIESVFLSLMGGVIGMAVSQAVLSILNVLFTDYHFAISPSVAALALGFSVAIGLIFGIYPANRAAKLKPINALRYE